MPRPAVNRLSSPAITTDALLASPKIPPYGRRLSGTGCRGNRRGRYRDACAHQAGAKRRSALLPFHRYRRKSGPGALFYVEMWIRTVEPDGQQHSNEWRIALPGIELAQIDANILENRSCDGVEKLRRFGLRTQHARSLSARIPGDRPAGIEC
jgi:hypothetical protein